MFVIRYKQSGHITAIDCGILRGMSEFRLISEENWTSKLAQSRCMSQPSTRLFMRVPLIAVSSLPNPNIFSC